MTQAKVESIIKKLLWLGDREMALDNLSKENPNIDTTSIEALLGIAYPSAEWMEYLKSEVNLSYSFGQLDKNSTAFVEKVRKVVEDGSNKKLYYLSAAKRLAGIVDEVQLERGLGGRKMVRYSILVSKFGTVFDGVMRLLFVLKMLGLDTPSKSRMFLRGVSHNRAKYTQHLFTAKNLGKPFMVADFLAFMVLTWYDRYGKNKKQRGVKDHWHFDMSYYDRLKSNILGMLLSIVKEAKIIGKSRLSVELDMLEDADLGLWYSMFFSKFSKAVLSNRNFLIRYPLLKEEIRKRRELASDSSVAAFLEEVDKEVNKIWDSIAIPDYSKMWDEASIDDVAGNDVLFKRELIRIFYGNRDQRKEVSD